MGQVRSGQETSATFARAGGGWHGGIWPRVGQTAAPHQPLQLRAPASHGALSGPGAGHWKEGTSHVWRALR